MIPLPWLGALAPPNAGRVSHCAGWRDRLLRRLLSLASPWGTSLAAERPRRSSREIYSGNRPHLFVKGQPQAALPFFEKLFRISLDRRISGLVEVKSFEVEGIV